MNTPYSACLFDLDGTLTDSSEGITRGLSHMLTHLGIIPPDRSQLNSWIGPPISEMLTAHYNIAGSRIRAAVEVFRSYYVERGYRENRVYDGIYPLLEHLRSAGVRMMVATSKPESQARMILDHFALSDYFEFVGGNTLDNRRPTKQDVISHVLNSCSLQPGVDAVAMIGDRSYDVCGAARCQIDAVGVLYGFGDYEELRSCRPAALAASPRDLEELLCLPEHEECTTVTDSMV